MARAILLFTTSALLSIATFYFKSEHRFDLQLVAPVGAYFIIAYFLAFQPKVGTNQKIQFAGLALLVWLVLFMVSYNLLFVFIVPVAGGLGAWLIMLLGKRYLEIAVEKPWPIIWTGVAAAFVGLAFMIMVKKQASIGMKAGLLTAVWQVGVGWQLTKYFNRNSKSSPAGEGTKE